MAERRGDDDSKRKEDRMKSNHVAVETNGDHFSLIKVLLFYSLRGIKKNT